MRGRNKNGSRVIELRESVIVKLFTVENEWRSLFEPREKKGEGNENENDERCMCTVYARTATTTSLSIRVRALLMQQNY